MFILSELTESGDLGLIIEGEVLMKEERRELSERSVGVSRSLFGDSYKLFGLT